MRSSLAVAFAAVLAAAVLSACGGSSPSDRFVLARQGLADTLHTTPDKIGCKDFGTFDGRLVASCHVIGGASFETGCYEADTGDDLTLAVRNDRGSQQVC